MRETLEIVRGGGNVFADLGLANSDVEQTKALLAAEIIRNLDLDRFTIDRLMKVLGDCRKMTCQIAPDFCLPSRRGNRRIASYVTVAVTRKASKKTSKMVFHLTEIALGRFDRRVDVRLSVKPRKLEPA